MAGFYKPFTPNAAVIHGSGALGRGLAQAGQFAQNYGQMTLDEIARRKQLAEQLRHNSASEANTAVGMENNRVHNAGMLNLAQGQVDQKVADQNATIGSYAKVGASQYPDLAKSTGYDAANPNIFTQDSFGRAVQAKVALDSAQPKPQIQDTATGIMQYDPASKTWRPTGMDAYRDPSAGMTSDQKNFADIYGYNTPQYRAAMDNLAQKKQMIPVMDQQGNVTLVTPNGGRGPANSVPATQRPPVSAPQPVAQNAAPTYQPQPQAQPQQPQGYITKRGPQPTDTQYKAVDATMKAANDLNFLSSNYNDKYVGSVDGRLNELYRKAGLPENKLLNNEGYGRFQQSLANLNNKERNALMGAVLTPQEIEAFNKQTISETDSNEVFQQKLAHKQGILKSAFARQYNQIADTYGDQAANQMFESSDMLPQLQQERAARRGGVSPQGGGGLSADAEFVLKKLNGGR